MDRYIRKLRTKIGNDEIKVPGCRIIVTNQGDEVLLQLRSDYRLWGLPAGSVESDETALQAAARELKEETNLEATSLIPIGYSSASKYEHITYPNGHKIHCHTMVFFAQDWNGSLRPDFDESLELSFFSLNYLPQMLPNMAATLKMFQNWRETGIFQFA